MKRIIFFLSLLPTLSQCQKVELNVYRTVSVRPHRPATPPPAPSPKIKALFVFIGESNSGGYGQSANASVAELAPRNKTYILNNSTYSFEALDIGTNNYIGHIGITVPETRHGWELQIANLVDSGYLDTTYIVKTGQGGSRSLHWLPDVTYTNSGSIQPYNEAVKRIDSAISKTGITNVIFFWSLGINDCLLFSDTATVRPNMESLINNLRVKYGNAPFVMTKIFSTITGYQAMNQVYATLQSRLGNIYTVETEGLSRVDSHHWDYAGLKILARRMIDAFVTNGYNILK